MDADLQRRTLAVRIDSGINPTHRRFEFDPVNETLRLRFKIAEAACVIWRAYFNAGAPRIANDDAGGFTDWNRLCRQPVLWLAREGYADALGWGQLGDPAASMLVDPAGSDPELEALGDLMRGLHACADGAAFTSNDVLKWWQAGEHDEDGGAFRLLREAVFDLLNLRPGSAPTARGLGSMLKYRRDRVVGGLKVQARDDTIHNAKLWRVVMVS